MIVSVNMQTWRKMTMSNEYRMLYVGYWLRRFLSEYLVTVRNMSKNTIKSYRDTFKLLLPFAAKPCKKTTDDLLLTDISISRVVSFLNMLEKERKCTIRTRNQRLAAIHAFAKYVSINSTFFFCPVIVLTSWFMSL